MICLLPNLYPAVTNGQVGAAKQCRATRVFVSARLVAASLSRDTKERQRPAPWEQQVRGGRTVVHVQENVAVGLCVGLVPREG